MKYLASTAVLLLGPISAWAIVIDPHPVPEPSTWTLIAGGVAAAAIVAKMKRRK